MAGEPACCLTADEWRAQFEHWIEHGAPADLLNASIYFDLRPIAGNAALAEPLRALIAGRGALVPRFVKQLADNALERRPPLNWFGGVDTTEVDGRATIDLKLQGTAIFVDAARLYALAHGIAETGTRARFEAVGRALGVAAQEAESWSAGFEFLQTLRLAVQVRGDVPAEAANRVDVQALNHIGRRMLKESLRVARLLQQRIELDYRR
jgi:CBS domain-containing protein